jgi:hypothetical protein
MFPEETISFKLSKPQNNKEMYLKGSCKAEEETQGVEFVG